MKRENIEYFTWCSVCNAPCKYGYTNCKKEEDCIKSKYMHWRKLNNDKNK